MEERGMKKRNRIILAVIILSLTLLSCIGSELVRKGAEPIDRQGCKIDCKDLEFYSYDYPTHTCKCKTKDEQIITIYSWIKEDK